jgi:flagellar M-ring protein FliF
MAGIDADVLRERAARAMRSFSPSQLAIVGLLGVATLIGGMTFVKWASTPSYGVLFSGLESKDAAAVVDKLKAQNVPYRLENGGSSVLVPSAKVYETRLSLSSAGLPKGGTVGYELLDKQGITTSDFRQHVDYQRALEGELTRTLMAMTGVEAASVHLAIPEQQLFSDEKESARASVLLKLSDGLGDDAVSSIVHLVASSVPGLPAENVTVADTQGHALSANQTGAGATRELRLTNDYNSQLAAQAGSMLSQVFGPGHAVVRVSSTLNFDETERQIDTYDSSKSTTLRQQTQSEVFSGAGTPPGAGAGALGVTPGQPPTAPGNAYQKQQDSKDFGIDHTVEHAKVAPGKLQRLSVAVVLDGSAKPVPQSDKVQKIVSAALGLTPDRGDTIVVDTVKFDTSLQKTTQAAQAKMHGQQSTNQMMGYARTGVGVLLLLLVSFFLLRGLKGSTRSDAFALPQAGPGSLAAALASVQTPAGALTAGGSHPVPAPMPTQLAAVAAGLPAVRTDDVLTMIEQQPEEVAVMLRGWLADRRA